jgi:hypothetical protein
MRKPKMTKERGRGMVPSRDFGIQDKVYGSFLSELDPVGRSEVQHALACSKDPRFRRFLELIGRKIGRNTISLQATAKMCDISLAEFNEWTNSTGTQQALAIALRRAPQIAEVLASNAVEVVEFCERCDGTGVVTAPAGMNPEPDGYRMAEIDREGEELWVRTCPHGSDGKIRRAGSEHAQDRILEIAGLVNQKGPGISVAVNLGGAGHQSAVPALSAMTIDCESERV